MTISPSGLIMERPAMQLTQAQDQLVRATAAAVSFAGWERIVLDVEIEETAEDYAMDTVSFAIVKGEDGALRDPEIALDRPQRDAIIDLFKVVRSAETGGTFGGFRLTIDADGRYRFAMSYDAPKRLHGIWDAQKEGELDRYLETYRAGDGGKS